MNNLVIVVTGILGATLTHYISENLRQGAVRASALPSLVIGVFFYCFPEILNAYLTKNIQIVFIGASFIGMVSSKAMGNYGLLALAGSLYGIIYINKSQFFEGFGGALGTLALIALLTAMGISVVLSKKNKIARGILVVRKRFITQRK